MLEKMELNILSYRQVSYCNNLNKNFFFIFFACKTKKIEMLFLSMVRRILTPYLTSLKNN